MGLKVFVASITSTLDIKKKIQKVQMILDGSGIKYDSVDIAMPGREKDREFMREHGKIRNGAKFPQPPQIFGDDDAYVGDYEDFINANEGGAKELLVFLGLKPPEPEPTVVEEVVPDAESSPVENGTADEELNEDGVVENGTADHDGDETEAADVGEDSPVDDQAEEQVEKNEDDNAEETEGDDKGDKEPAEDENGNIVGDREGEGGDETGDNADANDENQDVDSAEETGEKDEGDKEWDIGEDDGGIDADSIHEDEGGDAVSTQDVALLEEATTSLHSAPNHAASTSESHNGYSLAEDFTVSSDSKYISSTWLGEEA